MAIVLTDAVPLTSADGITGRNNGHDIRKGLLSTLFTPDVKTDPMAVRNGVVPKDWDSAGCKSLRIDQTTTASQNVKLNPGSYLSERSGQGPYIGWLELSAGVTVPLSSSNSSNPRIDVLYVTVLDKASIGTDTSSDPIIDILEGTPNATPTAPTALPDGAVPLAQVYRKASSPGNTVTTADITDVRKSAGLIGSVRVMLPGDKVSDPGKVSGEMRYRPASGSLPALIDFWDGAQLKWRGTQGFKVTGTFPGTPNSASLVSGTIPTAGSTLISTTIPDPGFPYTITANATLQQTSTSGGCNYLIRTTGGSFVSVIVNQAGAGIVQLSPNESTVFNGSQTIVLAAAPLSGGTKDWQADVRNKLTLRIEPA